jgi:hypothetical protein
MSRDESDPMDSASERQHERAEHTENILSTMEIDFGRHEYPVSSEELAMEYADQPTDLANETESLGSVFDRLTDQTYDSPEEVRESLYNEMTGTAAGMSEYNEERPLHDLEDSESDERA